MPMNKTADPILTIFTPAYNRAHTLLRTYEKPLPPKLQGLHLARCGRWFHGQHSRVGAAVAEPR